MYWSQKEGITLNANYQWTNQLKYCVNQNNLKYSDSLAIYIHRYTHRNSVDISICRSLSWMSWWYKTQQLHISKIYNAWVSNWTTSVICTWLELTCYELVSDEHYIWHVTSNCEGHYTLKPLTEFNVIRPCSSTLTLFWPFRLLNFV